MLQNNLLKTLVKILAAALLMGLLSSPALALKSDKDQPVNIEADSVDIDEAKEVAIYRGNVLLTQGSIKLQASRVVVRNFQSDNALLIATGKPVHFSQLPDNSKLRIKAKSNKLEYEINATNLTLSGKAELTKGKNTFKNDRIIYDRDKALVKAGRSAEGKDRVKITLGGKKK